MHRVSYFGLTNGRPPRRRVGIYQHDRLQHMYVIGKTGTGKSTLLENLIRQDIEAGRAVIFIDPHGDLAERIAAWCHVQGYDKRLTYLDIPNASGRFGYNPLRGVAHDSIPLAASGLLETFRNHFGEKAWGNRMEHIFRNVLFALLEYGEATLPDVLRMLDSRTFREQVLRRVQNTQVRYFFTEQFEQMNPRFIQEAIAPIQSKVGAYLTDPRINATLVEFEHSISLRRIMDTQGILVVNLSRGVLGTDTSHLLGSLLVSTVGLAALSRAHIPESRRVPCFLYLDEFEHLLTGSMATMLSEVRKVKLGLILAHQYLYQLPESTRAAVLGNVGTLICFRVGIEDARILAREFEPVFGPADLVGLANYEMCLKLMIDGTPSAGFSATGIRAIS